MKQLRSDIQGFSLIEVLVALVIIGVGMLGIAKIQALAYSSTATASLRSLAAIEASSLAAAMRANQNYWTTAAAATAQTISIVGGAVTASTDGTLVGTAGSCSAATFGSSAALAPTMCSAGPNLSKPCCRAIRPPSPAVPTSRLPIRSVAASR